MLILNFLQIPFDCFKTVEVCLVKIFPINGIQIENNGCEEGWRPSDLENVRTQTETSTISRPSSEKEKKYK